jgi:magnesium chelatase family protein
MPARFQIVAAANPCPCGHGEDSRRCQCRPDQIRAYEARLSGALADRFDLSLAVEQPTADELAGDPGEASAPIAARVAEARERAAARLGPGRSNSSMTERELTLHAEPDAGGAEALSAGHAGLGLSGRGWSRVLKVARTCADLDGVEVIGREHVDRALTMRRRTST